jgi:hypothetical protein
MSPDTETELQRGRDAEDALEGQADELEERIGELGDHIDDAKDGLRARSDEIDDLDLDDDEDEDADEDPLAFDDPEEDEEDDEDI